MPVLRQVVGKQRPQVTAAAWLGLTARPVRRLLQRVRQEGDRGLVHRGRGQPLNRRMPEKRTATVVKLYEEP